MAKKNTKKVSKRKQGGMNFEINDTNIAVAAGIQRFVFRCISAFS